MVRLLAFSSVGDRRRRLGAIDRPDKFWVRGDRAVRVRTGEEGTGHGHAEQCLADVLGGPGVVSGRGGAAHDAPDERHPGHRFGELKPDLPDVVGALASADAEELLDAGALVLLLLVRHRADGEVRDATGGPGWMRRRRRTTRASRWGGARERRTSRGPGPRARRGRHGRTRAPWRRTPEWRRG